MPDHVSSHHATLLWALTTSHSLLLQLSVPEAIDKVVIHHANRLHESITDRAADELEAPAFQVLAHGIRFGCLGRNDLHRLPCVLLRLASDELPDVFIECAVLLLHGQKRFGILDGGLELRTMLMLHVQGLELQVESRTAAADRRSE